jgi:orotidine-5'-phosphate decarboxylase
MGSNAAVQVTVPTESHVDAAERLIVALDFEDVALAYSLIKRLGDVVSAYKVGYHLLLVPGCDRLISHLVDIGKQVCLDAKLCDTTGTARAGVAAAVGRGARFLTIHGNGDVSDAALEAAVETRGDSGLKLLLVTVLTSIDDLVRHTTGYRSSVMDEVKKRAERALHFGLDGVICSGHEANEVRSLAGNPDFIIATPGIRPSGSPREDQRRVMTPSSAISSGSDYLIIGRPIIKSPDPLDASNKIIVEMQEAFDSR